MRFSILALVGVALAHGPAVKTEVVTEVVTQDCVTLSTSTTSVPVPTTWYNGTHTVVTVVKPPHSSVTVVKHPHSTATVAKPPPSSVTVVKPPPSSITVVNPPHSTVTVVKPPHNVTTTRGGQNTTITPIIITTTATTTKGGSGPNPTGSQPPVVNAGASAKVSAAGLLGFAGIAFLML